MRDMSPLEWALRPIKKYAVFSGRASRAEYWWFYLATTIAGMATAVLDEFAGQAGITNGTLNLVLILPSLTVAVRRLHDTDRSGWWLFFFVIPLFVAVMFGVALARGNEALDDMTAFLVVGAIGSAIVIIALIVFMIQPGTPGPNRYGPDPYGPDDLEEVFG